MLPPSRTTTREPAPSTRDTASQPRITHLSLRSHNPQLQGSSTISPQASSLQHPPVVRPIGRDPRPRDARTNHCIPSQHPTLPQHTRSQGITPWQSLEIGGTGVSPGLAPPIIEAPEIHWLPHSPQETKHLKGSHASQLSQLPINQQKKSHTPPTPRPASPLP